MIEFGTKVVIKENNRVGVVIGKNQNYYIVAFESWVNDEIMGHTTIAVQQDDLVELKDNANR